ncbi:MAG TPA: branched-chain amino acid ABC transporter permease [Bacillota bacterium]|nr:branched-chain amino acid ABC transporter permease [Bacillota bacterium]HNU94802.1 branched-chain amino acid ABC transporter permease [Bacillota bacterium]HOI37906.1 branched-chain amino acid ABC transporter permease [Bacillota bacterium]
MFGQQVVSGLSAGCLYALAALGLVLIYRTMDIVNFAHGEMAMVSTFMAHTLLVRLGLSYIPAALGAIIFAFIFGMAVERIFLRPIQGGPLISLMIMTLGLFMVFNGAAGWVWGFDPVSFPRAVSGRPIWLGDLIITRDSILVLAVTIAMALALYVVLRFTMAGIAIRATSQNSRAARLMGVPVPKVYALTWGISAVLGAVAGILIAPTTFLSPSMMAEVQIKAFTAAVLGGFSSLPGAVVGGLLLGVLENLVAGYISTELKSTFAFALIVVVLFIRPSGLLGTPPKRKV